MWGAIAAAALPAVTGAIGEALSNGDKKKAEQLRAEAVRMFGEDNVPPLELLEAEMQGSTEFDKVQGDPQAKAAQRQAWLKMMQVANEGGMTAEDKAVLAEAQAMNAAQEQGQRQAIVENARARGIGGSGVELMSQLAAQQGAANRNNTAGVQAAAEARRRAWQALSAGAGLATDMRGQAFSEQAARASAQDAINRFNTENSNSTNRFNQDLRQQHYENQFAERRAKAGYMTGQSDAYDEEAKRKRRLVAGAVEGGAQAASPYMTGGGK